jgi:hypothetical protein
MAVSRLKMRQLRWAGCLVALALATAEPGGAETSNFDSLTLAPGFPKAVGRVRGYTSGSFALSLRAKSDRDGNPCLGLGTAAPDHFLRLQQGFPRLSLQVKSPGNDTTLMVEGPGNFRLCGDDTGRSKNASVSAADWPAGTYRIWVGTLEPGQKRTYTLTVQEP